uniref:ATP synthase F0 subunit 6 n=1 Tax=Alectorobius peruvianus TaxID=879266 RepID=UPI00223897BF|nr:ATP synthase F0 subunit 6 [Alectorobius peruvianus]UYB78526.1 ATP synthase F0 subunit 6 [Alectorobius peruvianus]
MMMNLFSTFDPSTTNTLSINWISTLLIFMLTPQLYWSAPSRLHTIWFILSGYLLNDLNSLFDKKKKLFMLLCLTLFWFIMTNNSMGLFPYIFTSTSHINLTTILALPLWLTLMLYGWINQTNHMFSHLVPNGTPLPLSIFMVLIETTSNLIRPVTLSIRLSANMISGHLLLCLLSNILESLPMFFLFVTPLLMVLLTLEVAVATIQSYVFITLFSLYLNELN